MGSGVLLLGVRGRLLFLGGSRERRGRGGRVFLPLISS